MDLAGKGEPGEVDNKDRRNKVEKLATVDLDTLDGVNGGAGWFAAAKAAGKTALKKVALPVTAGFAGYAAGKNYAKARNQGKGVGASAWAGAKGAAKDLVEYDLWGPTVFGK